jgi:DNA-binding NarL/FixJ family response regulator
VKRAIQVMLVDDSAEARQSLRMLLELEEDIQVLAEADDGAQALEQLATITPDVVLMDMNMPVMDGVTATEKICAEYPNISVILVSVQTDVECVHRCLQAGARKYLHKPVDPEVLLATVREVGGTSLRG